MGQSCVGRGETSMKALLLSVLLAAVRADPDVSHHASISHGHPGLSHHNVPVHHAAVHAAPAYHAPAPAYHVPEPVYPPPQPVYHAPKPVYQKPKPVYHAPKPVYHEKEYPPEPYTYEYAVADDYSQTNFRAGETSDGNVVSGSYSVQLPDGRIQHVKYTADHYNGYQA